MADSNFVNKVKKSNAVYNIQDQRIENISSLSTATNAVNGSGKSVKIGTGLTTNTEGALFVGSYNNIVSGTTPLFQVGNGTSGSSSNAFTVLKDGKVVVSALNKIQDGSGNTLASSSDLTSAISTATDSINAGAVHKTGDESISGVKTFSNDTHINGKLYLGDSYLKFEDQGGQSIDKVLFNFHLIPTTNLSYKIGEPGKILYKVFAKEFHFNDEYKYVVLPDMSSWGATEHRTLATTTDLEPLVTTADTNQTIAGNKTFSGTTSLSTLSVSSISTSLIPSSTGSSNLGSASKRWKNLYVSGMITNSTETTVANQKGLLIPDTTNWSGSRVIATTTDLNSYLPLSGGTVSGATTFTGPTTFNGGSVSIVGHILNVPVITGPSGGTLNLSQGSILLDTGINKPAVSLTAADGFIYKPKSLNTYGYVFPSTELTEENKTIAMTDDIQPVIDADSSLVRKTGTQTISGSKTFSGSTTFSGTVSLAKISSLLPSGTAVNIGSSDKQWKHLFLSGYIGNSNSGFGLVLPNTSGWQSNKIIATNEDIDNDIADLLASNNIWTGVTRFDDDTTIDGDLGVTGVITVGDDVITTNVSSSSGNSLTLTANNESVILNTGGNKPSLSIDSTGGFIYQVKATDTYGYKFPTVSPSGAHKTIATTSDLSSYLPKSGGTVTGATTFNSTLRVHDKTTLDDDLTAGKIIGNADYLTTVGRAVVLEGSTVALTTGSGNPVLEVFDDEGFKYRRSNNDSYAYMFPTGQLSENKIIATTDLLDAKQNTLVSGTNIKTVNGYNIMGSGNISIVEANPAGTASQTLSKVKINNSLYDLAASIDIIDLR